MKKITIFFFILFVGSLIFTGCTEKVTTISGKIDKNVKLLYSNANIDICYDDFFLDTMVTNDKGEFQLKFALKEERFIMIKFSDSGRKLIIPIVPGEEYQITVDKNGKLMVEGANKDGIELYQSVFQYDPYSFNWEIFTSQSSEKRSKAIENIKKTELDSFKKLLAEDKISKKFYQLIENDRNCFYAFVAVWLYSWDYMNICRNPERNDNDVNKRQLIKQMDALFVQYNPDDPQMMKSPIWQMYAEFMYIRVFQQFSLKNMNKSNIELLLSEKNIPFWFTRIKATFSGKRLEAVLSTFIYKHGGAEGFSESKESIPVYEYFKTTFPNSPYLKYFQHLMERTISFYDGNKANAEIKFVQAGDSIETFSELISRFKGKKIYVDVWATWCNPCRGEFKYKDSLERIMEENNVTQLYISLDQEDQKDKWEAIVYTHNLKGYHFRANQLFIDDLNKIYSENINSGKTNESGKKSFSIPWYLFIDENGKIINSNAPRPSNVDEIKELFAK